MKKEFEVHTYCNGVHFTVTSSLMNSITDSFLKVNLRNNSEIIGTAVNLIFNRDRLQRRVTGSKFIWYNSTVHVEILYGNKTIIDTRENKYKVFQPLLRYNNSSSSKRRFGRILYYLANLGDAAILFQSTDDNHVEEVNRILKSVQNVDDFNNFNHHYNNYQLAVLCRGMSESGPRALAEQYFKNNYWSAPEKKKADKYVNTAISKYGIDFLDYCLELPKKPFKIRNVKRVFRVFEKPKISNPAIRIVIGGREVNLYYDAKAKEINIKNEAEQSIGKLDKNGLVSTLKNVNNYNVTIALLLAFADDPLRQILYYGAQTGRCSFCSKELTDPISITCGYGKTCASNYDLPWG